MTSTQRLYLKLSSGEPHSMVEFERFDDGTAALSVHFLEEQDGMIVTTGRTGASMTADEAAQLKELMA